MKTKHTPEPWKWDESWGAIVVDRPDMQKLICPMWTGCDRARMGRDVVDEDLANAARIVACVNACAGMTDPASEIAALKAQREKLLAACNSAIAGFKGVDAGPGKSVVANTGVYRMILAAIAKAEGGAA